VEGLLVAVILFQLSSKSYKPPQEAEGQALLFQDVVFLDIASRNVQLKATSLQEIDDLCDEWEPEPLCPPIKEGGRIDSPMLERYVSRLCFQ
jgi:serine palmitoyltransferase